MHNARLILNELINTIESVAPTKWQEEWDNSGLQVGDRNADISAALLTIDVTESVVDEAIEKHCDLIISHHPLLFHGLKAITGETPQARIVTKAIRHGIAIYSAHTNMDSYLHGVSGRMAEQLGIRQYRILVDGGQCTMHDDASAHTDKHGLGVIGQLPQPLPFDQLLQLVKTTFGAPAIRYTQPTHQQVQTIALCGGAGAEFIDNAIAQGADVYITADIKYHDFCNAAGQIALIDLDHWVSEHFTRDIFKELLDGQVTTYISKTDKSPVLVV
ncbi:MAG: Nif3-like dinuclear metal center hexameric protein [Paludibacteraceae bacterium]|nr:Nif3-like dinuclear metal center hexameric protein [Paludibacteraceae bacterium]